MKVRQISVFLENKSGRLAEVARILGGRGINIRALSLADTADFGILRLIVNDPERALAVLKAEGMTVHSTEVIAVRVPDRPGGLAGILGFFEAAGMNIEYMYAFVTKAADDAVVVFRVEEIERAIAMLREKGITLLTGEEIYRL